MKINFEQYKTLFADVGFSPGETRVYFALLELGETTIGPLAKKAQVTSAKTYPIIEKLKTKGLITSVIKNNTQYFQLFHPTRIIDYLEEKENNLSKQKEAIKKIIPQLEPEKIAEQYATVYETMNGIKTLYDEIINYLTKTKEDFICFSMGDEFQNETMNRFFKQQNIKRHTLGITTKIIGREQQQKFLSTINKDTPSLMIRYLKQTLPSGIIIWGDNVATLLWQGTPTAFIIHSEQNARMYRQFFYELWEQAKE